MVAFPSRRGVTPVFGYVAPHPSGGGTSTLQIKTLPSTHYVPLRLPTGPVSGYVFPLSVGPSSGPEFGPPSRVSQVPRSICRHPPSSTTPGSPTVASPHYFTVGGRLRPFREVSHSQLLGFHEAESGSLALRLTSSHSQASPGWSAITPLGSFMANEQLPWSVPFT